MRYGIPLRGDRVAPRSTCADALLVVVHRRNHIRAETSAELPVQGLLELAKVLSENRVDILVCGGISREERDYLKARRLDVIDNVVASVEELLAAIGAGRLYPGFGMTRSPVESAPSQSSTDETSAGPDSRLKERDQEDQARPIDCLACRNQVCRKGEVCEALRGLNPAPPAERETSRIMEASLDISFEKERTLCRLSELIYFCLDMRYRRIGLAYCIDLEEPADILVRVLRRFFEVYPVCCKVGGETMSDPLTAPAHGRASAGQVVCNPAGQASVLNRLNTDLNVQVGLCMGADCIFTQYSDAPVTTLFVKDKSLANNPIGAVYSDYYIDEAIQASQGGS